MCLKALETQWHILLTVFNFQTWLHLDHTVLYG